MVVDTSAVLAVLFDEAHGAWAASMLNRHAVELRMSTVNLTECLFLIRDRQPQLSAQLEERILQGGFRFVPPDIRQARIAAEARLRFPLNLGDCFAYALAVAEGCPVLAVDRDFEAVDIPVALPPAKDLSGQ
jgi:ribonuclease VapC